MSVLLRAVHKLDDTRSYLDDLKEQGWCFVEFESSLDEWGHSERPVNITEPVDHLKQFFQQSSSEKQKCSAPFGFGYSSVDHKEGLRVLTGRRLLNGTTLIS